MMLGKNIRYLRLKRGWSQDLLAEKMGYKSYTTIQKWETGISEPQFAKAKQLAELFNIDIDSLTNKDLSEQSNVVPIQSIETVQIPVYGKVPAGPPTEAIEYIEDTIDIPASWVTCGQEYIGLTVSGDSMFPKYIDGDIVVIRLQPDCESGQDCVVYVNGFDSTLKRVVKERDGIILQPLNPEYSPKMYGYNDEFNPVTILGVVVELRRKI